IRRRPEPRPRHGQARGGLRRARPAPVRGARRTRNGARSRRRQACGAREPPGGRRRAPRAGRRRDRRALPAAGDRHGEGLVIVCVGLATRDTILAVPRHPAADDRVVATERVSAGGGPAATAAVAIARLGGEVRFVGVIDGELEGVEVVRVPGRMAESTILVGDGTRAIVTTEPEPFEVPAGALDGADWVHVDHVGYPSLRGASARLSVDASLARGLELRDALTRANACAALSCRALDGRSAIPTWDELERSLG